MSDGRASMAFSESDYHDAVEELSEVGGSGRASMDSGSFTGGMGSPSAAGLEHHHQQQQQPQSLVERIASWWEGRRATNQTSASGEDAGGTPRHNGHASLTPRSPSMSPQVRLAPSAGCRRRRRARQQPLCCTCCIGAVCSMPSAAPCWRACTHAFM